VETIAMAADDVMTEPMLSINSW